MILYITQSLINFLNSSTSLSNSNIILTDLEQVVFASFDIEKDYLNNKLSDSLKNFLYSHDLSNVHYFNTTVECMIPLIINDNISKYKSQIILPIVHNNITDGLLVFFSEDREYLPSNLKFAETTKHFTELFSTKDYL